MGENRDTCYPYSTGVFNDDNLITMISLGCLKGSYPFLKGFLLRETIGEDSTPCFCKEIGARSREYCDCFCYRHGSPASGSRAQEHLCMEISSYSLVACWRLHMKNRPLKR